MFLRMDVDTKLWLSEVIGLNRDRVIKPLQNSDV